MKKLKGSLKVGTRVRYLDHPFLSDGYVKQVIKGMGILLNLRRKPQMNMLGILMKCWRSENG